MTTCDNFDNYLKLLFHLNCEAIVLSTYSVKDSQALVCPYDKELILVCKCLVMVFMATGAILNLHDLPETQN